MKNINFLKRFGLKRTEKEEAVDNSTNEPNPNQDDLSEDRETVNGNETVNEGGLEGTDEISATMEKSDGQSELAVKNEEIQALNDKYLRLAAEFENFKRRAQRDQSDTVRFANEKLLKDLLPTIDNLERAIACGREQTDNNGLLEGVELTYKQFLDTLEKVGVKQVVSVGEPFDPAKHQAVGQVESSNVPENCVVDEYQKGYFLQERILRPAMVTVAKPVSGDSASGLQEEESQE